ncbi:hypothetical protein BC938DRAFT_480277 [Jimgerdemannia flammicorona]|uniref:Glucokinase n=1 Tax=Jimgerdemannia flammicorona TaxID=994334 RepID=A0A433QIX4_9FUNG|nr:hypothetical protein BC938DRAFT_480277 [Jimgerdemannia flammicorona]
MSTAQLSTQYCIGIDLGGTKLQLIATSRESMSSGSFHSAVPSGPEYFAQRTPTGPTFIPATFAISLRAFLATLPPAASIFSVGVAICGLVDPTSGDITLCEVSGLVGWNIAKAVREELHALEKDKTYRIKAEESVKIEVVNDAAAALEYVRRFEAMEDMSGERAKDVAVFVVGTGIATALLVNDTPVRGHLSFAGNLGIAPVLTSPPGSGSTKMLDELAGGRALAKRILDETVLTPSEAIELLAEKTVEEIQGDKMSRRLYVAIVDAATSLGIAVANVVCLMNPRLVVLAGVGIVWIPSSNDHFVKCNAQNRTTELPFFILT